MPSNVSTPGVLILFKSLAIVIRGHVNLQGPLLIELSGFWLMAASSMKAQGGREKKSINKKKSCGVQMQTETHQMVPF